MIPLRTNLRARRRHRDGALVLLLAGALPAQAAGEDAQAAAMVFHAFPEADSFRRIVRDVDQKARSAIERQLPFKVHFDELGPHTLFVAFRSRQPVGLLYLRSEEAEWGLTEIAWALTLDLRVLGFQFQRGRSRHQHDLETSAFARNLVGSDLTRLGELVADGAARGLQSAPADAEQLATIVLRSGTKALLVVDTVWREEVHKLQDLAMGFDAFPTADRFLRRILQFEVDAGGSQQVVIASVVRATAKGNQQLGAVVRTEVSFGGKPLVLRWVVDAELRVLQIEPAQSWADDDLRVACRELEGHLLAGPPDGASRLQALARGLGRNLARLDPARGVR